MFRKGKWKSESGQAMVEFALVLPLFLIITLGIMEVGWLTYQDSIFKYAYTHASWDITEADISSLGKGDYEGASIQSYDEAVVRPAIIKAMERNNTWGLKSGNVEVTNVRAVCSNKDEAFYVPGWDKNLVEGTNRTRWLDLQADLNYKVPVLTYVGRIIFGSDVVVRKGKIECKRIVAEAHRTE